MTTKTKKTQVKKILSFSPKQVTKRLLTALPERARDVIICRYALGSKIESMTLDAIGQIYGITRERVRQIENAALDAIRHSDVYDAETPVFSELEEAIVSLGSIVSEVELLKIFTKDTSIQNHIHFLLVLGNAFVKEKENPDFEHRWYVGKEWADKVKDALKNLYKNLSDEALIPESEMITLFLEQLEDATEHYRDEEILRRWLGISKKIGRNPLGEWGKKESPNITPKGIKDHAYLVIRQHGSPMHFREVADKIAEFFEKRAHTATAHNELIKDDRFVLVGRGLYALSEWGYMTGVVKDVIAALLKKNGPMTRDEVVDKVLTERYVKENTIVVNLQDTDLFEKLADGRYKLIR
jgi:hypothetical protein